MPTRLPRPPSKSIGERDQRNKRQHHRADGDRELHASLRALRGGHDDVRRLHALFERLGDIDLRSLRRHRCRPDRQA